MSLNLLSLRCVFKNSYQEVDVPGDGLEEWGFESPNKLHQYFIYAPSHTQAKASRRGDTVLFHREEPGVTESAAGLVQALGHCLRPCWTYQCHLLMEEIAIPVTERDGAGLAQTDRDGVGLAQTEMGRGLQAPGDGWS